ncbi:MAG: MerR family regulatory protein [Frankiales bacterium]|nr:MerR family regulatory protein [Frankiales bacterium]
MTTTPRFELLRVGEAAKALGVTPDTLRRWAKEGRVGHVELPSGQIRFRQADLDAVLVERPAKAAG